MRGRRKKQNHGRNDKNDLRVNRQIRIKEVYLIDEEGEPVGNLSTIDAQRKAEAAGLDLVEVSPNARPPVCKILDYGKYKYRQKKKHAQQKTHQAKVKEVRLHPRTDEHDVVVRIKQARRFLDHGDKVLLNVWFKGREIVHKDFGFKLLLRFKEEFRLSAKVEKEPSMEGRKMTMLLAPLPIEKRRKLERDAEEAAAKAEREQAQANKRRKISREEVIAEQEAAGNPADSSVKAPAEAGE